MKKWFVTEKGKLRFHAVLTIAATTGLLWIVERWLEQFPSATIHVINAFVVVAAAIGLWITVVVIFIWLLNWSVTSKSKQ